MNVEPRLERTYRVRFDEAGPHGSLRASGHLRFAQDLAWLHSESAGFGRDWYAARGLTWLVRAIELDVIEEVAYGTELSVSTEVVGFRRVWARRRSEIKPVDSERPIAVALTDWVLLNADGRLVRPPDEILDVFTAPSAFTPMRLKVPGVPSNADSAEIRVRFADIDPMAHVNNAAYLDYVDEVFLGLTGRGRMPLPRRYRADFVQPAEPSAILSATSWTADDAWWLLLDDEEGRPSFRAALELSPSRWVGG